LQIHLATWLEDSQARVLTKTDYARRLLSYFFIRDTYPSFLERYVTTGFAAAKPEVSRLKRRQT